MQTSRPSALTSPCRLRVVARRARSNGNGSHGHHCPSLIPLILRIADGEINKPAGDPDSYQRRRKQVRHMAKALGSDSLRSTGGINSMTARVTELSLHACRRFMTSRCQVRSISVFTASPSSGAAPITLHQRQLEDACSCRPQQQFAGCYQVRIRTSTRNDPPRPSQPDKGSLHQRAHRNFYSVPLPTHANGCPRLGPRARSDLSLQCWILLYCMQAQYLSPAEGAHWHCTKGFRPTAPSPQPSFSSRRQQPQLMSSSDLKQTASHRRVIAAARSVACPGHDLTSTCNVSTSLPYTVCTLDQTTSCPPATEMLPFSCSLGVSVIIISFVILLVLRTRSDALRMAECWILLLLTRSTGTMSHVGICVVPIHQTWS